jgi:type IV pilus assembly protein PilO
MSRSYKSWLAIERWRRLLKQPRALMRAMIGVLLAANLVAAVFAFHPFGGSAEDLERQLAALQREVLQKQAALTQTRAIAAKIEKARAEADKFMTGAFVSRRAASSTMVSELVKSAKQVGMRPREHSFVFEPVEGSDTLSMMTITGNYEGSYADLVQFVNLLDRSPRFLIIEFMQAAPQSSGGMLNVSMKLNTFVREDGEAK